MTPQIARLYAYVLPIFWPYLWLQLRWIFKRQDQELRTLLISVTRWGHVHIVRVGDSWRAYRKPVAVKASWDDPVWESHISPNMAGLLLEESQTLLAPNPSAPPNPPHRHGEGARRPPQKHNTGRAARAFRPPLLLQTKNPSVAGGVFGSMNGKIRPGA